MTVGQVFFLQLAAHGLSRENRYTLIRGAGFLLGLGLLGIGVMFLAAVQLTAVLYSSLAEAITPLLCLLALSLPLTFLCLFLFSSLQALHQETKSLISPIMPPRIVLQIPVVTTPLLFPWSARPPPHTCFTTIHRSSCGSVQSPFCRNGTARSMAVRWMSRVCIQHCQSVKFSC